MPARISPGRRPGGLPSRLLGVAIGLVALTLATAATPETEGVPRATCLAQKPGNIPLTVTSGGLARTALVHVPPAGRHGRPLPLVVAYHGAGGTGAWMEDYTGLSGVSDQKGFLVVYPDAYGPRRVWSIGSALGVGVDDVAFTRDLLDAVTNRLCVNPNRIFATGVSNGGGMAALAGCELGDRLRAIAPVAGGYSSLPTCRPARPVSVLEIHATADNVVPYSGRGPARAGDVLRFVRAWAKRDGCPRHGQRSVPARYVTRLAWGPCAGGTRVQHIRVLGGGHDWPGASPGGRGHWSPLSASQQVWRFFASVRP